VALDKILEAIISRARIVSESLGSGFNKQMYEDALVMEMADTGFQLERQKKINILHKKNLVGEYIADIVVNKKILVKIKVAIALQAIHQDQLKYCLKSTDYSVGLILNFGTPQLSFKKIAL